MRVDRVSQIADGKWTTLSARVSGEELEHDGVELWYKAPRLSDPLPAPGTPFAIALVLAAMRLNRPLEVCAPVSARVMTGIDYAMRAFAAWDPSLQPIAIEAEQIADEIEPAFPSGSLFSRGVDSWHTALAHRGLGSEHLLITVPDIDRMHPPPSRERALETTRQCAEELGFRHAAIRTNVRDFTERYDHWGRCFGTGLAAAVHAAGAATQVMMPSSVPWGRTAAWYSQSELVVPALSSESVQLRSHGWQLTRLGKIRAISTYLPALESLKVCFSEDTQENCGRCEKCVRTLADLDAIGVATAPAFEEPLRLHRLAGAGVTDNLRGDYEELALSAPRLAVRLAARAALLRSAAHERRARRGNGHPGQGVGASRSLARPERP